MNLILGFAVNSQMFGRVSLSDDNHALKWADGCRVVENYWNVSVFHFQIKVTTEGTNYEG